MEDKVNFNYSGMLINPADPLFVVGASGGGGRIAIVAQNYQFSGVVEALGGVAYSGRMGGGGTVYLKKNLTGNFEFHECHLKIETVIIDGNNQDSFSYASLNGFPSTVNNLPDLQLMRNAKLWMTQYWKLTSISRSDESIRAIHFNGTVDIR